MKTIFFFCIVFFGTLSVNSQNDKEITDYDIESMGYYMNIEPVINGFVFTDNTCNTIYHLHNGYIKKITSSPGCGRYFTISEDKKKIGFKQINDDGQAPVIYDLVNNKFELLHKPSNLCGQPSFLKNGIAFTINQNLIIKTPTSEKQIELTNYSNLIAISPNDSQIVYSGNDGQLLLMNFYNLKTFVISEKDKQSNYPKWSPDGKYILYQSGNMFLYNTTNQKTIDLKEGFAPKWSPNGKNIIFFKKEIENDLLKNTDLFIYEIETDAVKQITFTPNIKEMRPNFTLNNTILYDTYNQKSFYKLTLGQKTNTPTLIYKSKKPIKLSYFQVRSTKSEKAISKPVHYTHQVYDTPDWHYGYGSCAPATSIMAISYYNLVPKWPTNNSKLYPHSSDYGSYICTKYRLNEYYFENVDQTSGGEDAWGGYGYMWGLGSPYSQMRNYLAQNYLASVQTYNSSVTFSSVTAEIDADYPYPLCSMLSSSGHLILTQGYIENQKTLFFSDPYGDKNTPSWPSYDGQKAYYDWPGYNNGYENLDYDGSYGVVAWAVTARATEVNYNNTLIDDVYYHHGFEMNNSENGSQMRYFRDANQGYNNHFWYTLTDANIDDICWVRWIPTLDENAFYRISAYIPTNFANAQNAFYRIYHENGVTIVPINQNNYNDDWVDLGIYKLNPDNNPYVYLGDSTDVNGEYIAFDAMKFSKIEKPVASFGLNSFDFCVGETISFTNTSTNASNYIWHFPNNSANTSTEENPNIVYQNSGTFDIELIANGLMESDTLNLSQVLTIHDAPIANFSVNEDTLFLPNASAFFINSSTNSQSYIWDFGNGQYSTDFNPYCIYNQEGQYSVSLTAANSYCPSSVKILDNNITVHNTTNIIDNKYANEFIYPNPFSSTITLNNFKNATQIRIIDVNGQVLICEEFKNKIDLSKLEKGFYFLKITYDNSTTKNIKIIKK